MHAEVVQPHVDVNMQNLRTNVPKYDTAELGRQWSEARKVFEELDELDVPCAMTMSSRQIIFQTMRAMGAKTALDIGTFTGLSALTMALADTGYWQRYGRRNKPRDLMHLAGVRDRVEFAQADSVNLLKVTQRQFDFISIDGWHEAHQVYKEIPLAIEALKPNGILFLDDVQVNGPPPEHDHIKGPLLAIERLLLEKLQIKLTPVHRALDKKKVAIAFITRNCQ
jgi:predicted O-methyltransferase YrrM